MDWSVVPRGLNCRVPSERRSLRLLIIPAGPKNAYLASTGSEMMMWKFSSITDGFSGNESTTMGEAGTESSGIPYMYAGMGSAHTCILTL